MKITILIIVQNQTKTSKFDVSAYHGLVTVQNLAKTVYLKTCSKCLLRTFTQVRSLLTKLAQCLDFNFIVHANFMTLAID